MKIAVAGLGYVGLSNAAILAQHNEVVAVDIAQERVDLVNRQESPFVDEDLSKFLATAPLDLRATTAADEVYATADYVVVATPTDYDPTTLTFDTKSVESVIRKVVEVSPTAVPVIKSTVPVGFSERMSAEYGRQVVFSPEFLREGHALHDNLNPARIIVGDDTPAARRFADLLLAGSARPDTPVLAIRSTEAEAVKLFSNTYLAMRVAFFNELDTFAAQHDLSTRAIIDGVSLEPRIGAGYNNPSFGYGGYCLPKDTRQMLASYDNIPQRLMKAIVESNATRKDFVAEQILAGKPETVGIHRLVMKEGSDNFRSSSVLGIVNRLKQTGVEVVIHEPALDADTFEGLRVINDLDEFKRTAEVIVANRLTGELADVADRVYTRDVFHMDE
ncbi:nucleotide sugar dehydrogenase [Kribbella sp. DT2]|uniref:nucleotide sugar dehydrogenase n=1 Tax=Kribbella sp. DT2 TaxID=3393427 RepID=UPI003CF80414